MADTVKRADYCYATIDDKAGEGARLLGALRDAGVSLTAIHAFPVGGGRSQVDLFATDGAGLAAAAAKAGIKLSPTKQAFIIEGDDRLGAIAEITGKLAAARINVTAAEAIRTSGGRFCGLLWVKPGDVNAAAKVLGAT
jgi:hypothetical protein